ncbi:GNAT family N-acetyltransferase [Paraburkholderia rhizosphaerae]|uniref:L-amino acid N-acyltransferase YncA n=1 Tax=Paraburkholderia rhizosphaerae TaxID=480658 RepID=A0A4R8L4Z8_9BURK|nr:GNAT family N-acetyltransferase [Paraburkholderia rhizosphaerae]TDY37375.1 L-amino acid N-acyltransferase YncA [Paraburkholderia rhizosphaerae]
MIEVRRARFPEDRDAVVAIFREYIGSATVSLEFQDYESELASLPGKYAAPGGCVLLAWDDDHVIGCAGFRQVDDRTCEMKRVYVRAVTRGQNIGRQLVDRVMSEARAAGYARMCLDVLPEFVAARRLYESLGFTPAPPVTFNPIPGTAFLGIDL